MPSVIPSAAGGPARPAAVARPALRLLLAGIAIGTIGCLRVSSLATIHASLPPERLLTVDGQRVAVERAGEHGSPLVLLHGFGESTHVWRHLLGPLAEEHRVVAIDLNGFGFTERPRAIEDYTYAGQARLVLAVMDALGIDRAHLAGHSYGGGLALWIAGRHPERARSLVLVDNAMPTYSRARRSPLGGIGPLRRLALAAFLRPAYVADGLRAAYYDDMLVTPEQVEAVLAGLAVEGVSRAYRGLVGPLPRALAKAEQEQPPALESVTTPALVVWGRHDELIAVDVGERNARRLPDARFTVIEGCGHVPMEERPAELLALMREFLAERDRDGD